MFRRKPKMVEAEIIDDSTGWMIQNPFAEFVLLHTVEIKFMCMIGYTFFTGCKVFGSMPASASPSMKFVSLALACTGGGILVPIFLNGIPVPLANDYYIMALLISFSLHHYFPILRDVFKLSGFLKVPVIILFETLRTSVVVTLLTAAQNKIPPSAFSFAVFGPIFCGAVAGCGGAFFPLNKGLEPLKAGMAAPMATAFVGSAFFHIFTSTRLSDDVIDARKKAHVHLTAFFLIVGLCNAFGIGSSVVKTESDKKKK